MYYRGAAVQIKQSESFFFLLFFLISAAVLLRLVYLSLLNLLSWCSVKSVAQRQRPFAPQGKSSLRVGEGAAHRRFLLFFLLRFDVFVWRGGGARARMLVHARLLAETFVVDDVVGVYVVSSSVALGPTGETSTCGGGGVEGKDKDKKERRRLGSTHRLLAFYFTSGVTTKVMMEEILGTLDGLYLVVTRSSDANDTHHGSFIQGAEAHVQLQTSLLDILVCIHHQFEVMWGTVDASAQIGRTDGVERKKGSPVRPACGLGQQSATQPCAAIEQGA